MEMWGRVFPWVVFNIFVVVMLALDLGILHRRAHIIRMKEALLLSLFWISLAVVFCLGISIWQGQTKALEFLTGYIIEESLSVDNLFVFLLIFTYFRVPAEYRHKVLYWGILGAILMRLIFILTGVALIHLFHWVIYIFGVFLIFTGYRMAWQKDVEIHPEKNPVLKFFRRFFSVTENYVGGKFFVKKEGRLCATPLLIVLLMVESTDVVFAIDSIPAILAITHDPFLVYTSNIFAILGLRSIYFALAGLMQLFDYLHYGLSAILIFVGVKMLISDFYKIPIGIALGVVAGMLLLSILTSLLFAGQKGKPIVSREDLPESEGKHTESKIFSLPEVQGPPHNPGQGE